MHGMGQYTIIISSGTADVTKVHPKSTQGRPKVRTLTLQLVP